MLGQLILFADANTAANSLKAGISPLFSTLVALAATCCIFFLIFGGYYYMTSNGNPEKLERAKKTVRNAFIGLVIVVGAAGLVAIMQNAYSMRATQPQAIASTQVSSDNSGNALSQFVDKAITGFVQGVISSIGKPIIDLLKQFTTATPLMASNSSVFNVWVVIVGMSDILFLLVVAMLGFRIMSASVLGMEDVDLRSLVPQLIVAFIVANLSIFAIDAIISVSNAMIQALLLGMSDDIIWTSLLTLILGAGTTLNIGILFLLAVVVILGVLLLIYYLERMIVLYIGAVLSPLIVLLWLLPSFKDFAIIAAKTYIITIFVLFVQIVILMLAVSLFSSLIKGDASSNAFMTALLGIATLVTLLKTGRTMSQMALLSAGNYGLRRLGNTFVRSASHLSSTVKKSGAAASAVVVSKEPALAGAGGGSTGTGSTTTRILSNSGSGKFNQGTASKELTSRPPQKPIDSNPKITSTKEKLPRESASSSRQDGARAALTKKNTKGIDK